MKNSLPAILLLCLFAFASTAADQDPANVDQALEQTLEMLVSPEQRGKILSKDAKANKADSFALEVGGNEANKQKIYELSAKVMESLAKSNDKDPDKMNKVLEAASKDPESFAKTFTPEQQKMLRELAVEIEKTKGSTKPIP